MRILITNNTLAERAGSELYVRDIAVALLRLGHQPVAYSTRLGAVAEELRAATVPVIDHLSQLAIAPDIIHGQHHMDTMTALLRFPHVPAVYFCHGWLPWEEMPPHFPTIRRYVAIDDLCRERLQSEHGIAPESIRVIRNFVDLQRFGLRGELPAQPRRALAFSNYMSAAGLDIMRSACGARGIELDAIGASSGQIVARPEEILGNYDIVFAKGRSALEAMACGCAVITCDANGLGEMVAPMNYETSRKLNFGVRTLYHHISEEFVSRELDAYDATDAREVARRVRAEAGLDDVVAQILDLYNEAIAEHGDLQVAPKLLLQAASDYLREIADFTKGHYTAERNLTRAESELASLRLRAQQTEVALESAKTEAAEQRGRAEQAEQARLSAQHELDVERTGARQSELARAQLQKQRVSTDTALRDREYELAAIHGSRLWPWMNRIQRLKKLMGNGSADSQGQRNPKV